MKKHVCFALLLLLAGGICAQTSEQAKVSKEQWDAITAAEKANRFEEAAALREKIITDSLVVLRDRVTALTGYAALAERKRAGADGDKATAWAMDLEQAPGHDSNSLRNLFTLQLKRADAIRDNERREIILKRALANTLLDIRARSDFAGQLAKQHLLATDDIQGAAQFIKTLLDTPDISERDLMFVCKALGDYWKLVGNLEDAVAAYSIIYEKAPTFSASAAGYVRDVYLAFGEPAKAKEHYFKHADTIGKARADREFALKMIADESVELSTRKELFKLFLNNNPDDAAVRAKHAGLYADKDLTIAPNQFNGKVGNGAGNDNSPGVGSYNYVLELLDYGANTKSWSVKAPYILLKVKALAGLNREKEACSVIADYLELPAAQATAFERHLLRLTAAVLELPDKAGVARPAIDAANKASKEYPDLSSEERINVLVNLASIVSHSRKNDLARDIYACYEAAFVQQPRKSVKAMFFDEPVSSLDTFLKVRDRLQPELMDRKFKGNLEMIVATDIGSGSERAAALSATDKLDDTGKLYVLCDEEGVRFFFDIPDANGLALGAGLAGKTHTFELYFAPGWNQPYFSAGVRYGGPRRGWIYQTTYNNLLQQRFDESSGDYKTDVRYYANGFYASFFFDWDTMFDKLPDSPEKFFEFDNIDWSPNGGFAWSTRLNVHSRLEWGRVYFELTPEQLNRIKRRIIFKARRDYIAERDRPNGPVDLWKDQILGDPSFYNAKVQPLVEKLNSFLADVDLTMDAAAIDRVWREAVPGWKRLRYFVSTLRAECIETQLVTE